MSLADLANRLKASPAFKDIFEVKDPVEIYAGITAANNKPHILASLFQAETFFRDYLFLAWLERTNRHLQAPEFFAISYTNLQATEVSAQELVDANFPNNVPITAMYRFRRGSDPIEGANREGEEKSVNVAQSIRDFAIDPTRLMNSINIWGV